MIFLPTVYILIGILLSLSINEQFKTQMDALPSVKKKQVYDVMGSGRGYEWYERRNVELGMYSILYLHCTTTRTRVQLVHSIF